ncbi:2-amino-4-hydroxy-6-hydroxymethyldihydropteridine pyrophosphokinase [Gimesia alba]|uniref:2-amino-4-hydroxy-6-hydroxymethyldihydropteridine pyrophosphokinase n=1 Tax=Gimesia alba TaxID=2527973 RepID=A0A517RG07_9PLAN|nr:2-amino-4-hydroxy-6-hydroxymethyldihydropteridine diphosphokinase [Gimesia alba]QDT42797.1 2-amino-4-hydroxy-6-hydroxymethyldihydropteridine pyrophosphokinase [Gimesia alba]
MNQAFLALGSNISPEENLPQAVRLLEASGHILGRSSVWQSKPVGDTNQADFLNAAVLLETELAAAEICLEVIPQIERDLNRVRDPQNKNGPRTIDIDLVLFNSEQLSIEHRIIPDPDIPERVFLAVPLAELTPQFCVPGLERALAHIADELQAKNGSQLIRRDDVVL